MIGLIYKNICDKTFKFKNRFYLKRVNFFTISGKSFDNSNKVRCNGDYNLWFLPYNMFSFLSCRDKKKMNMLSMYKKSLQIEDVRQINYQYFLINKKSRLKDQFDSFNEETWYYIDSDRTDDLYILYYNIYFHKILDNVYVDKGFIKFHKTYEDFVRSIKTVIEIYKTKAGNIQYISKNDIIIVINEIFEILFLVLKEQGIFEYIFFNYDINKLNTFIPSYLDSSSVDTVYTDVLNINMILDKYNRDFVFDFSLLMDINHKNLVQRTSSSSALKFYIVMFRSGDKIKINLFITCKISDFYTECVILDKYGKSIKRKKDQYKNSQVVLHRFFTLDVNNNLKVKNLLKNIDTKLSNVSKNKMILV